MLRGGQRPILWGRDGVPSQFVEDRSEASRLLCPLRGARAQWVGQGVLCREESSNWAAKDVAQ